MSVKIVLCHAHMRVKIKSLARLGSVSTKFDNDNILVFLCTLCVWKNKRYLIKTVPGIILDCLVSVRSFMTRRSAHLIVRRLLVFFVEKIQKWRERNLNLETPRASIINSKSISRNTPMIFVLVEEFHLNASVIFAPGLDLKNISWLNTRDNLHQKIWKIYANYRHLLYINWHLNPKFYRRRVVSFPSSSCTSPPAFGTAEH